MCVLASEPAVHRPFVPARDIIVTRREIAAIVPAAVPSIAGWACLLGEVAAGQIGAVARHLAVLRWHDAEIGALAVRAKPGGCESCRGGTTDLAAALLAVVE